MEALAPEALQERDDGGRLAEADIVRNGTGRAGGPAFPQPVQRLQLVRQQRCASAHPLRLPRDVRQVRRRSLCATSTSETPQHRQTTSATASAIPATCLPDHAARQRTGQTSSPIKCRVLGCRELQKSISQASSSGVKHFHLGEASSLGVKHHLRIHVAADRRKFLEQQCPTVLTISATAIWSGWARRSADCWRSHSAL